MDLIVLTFCQRTNSHPYNIDAVLISKYTVKKIA